MNRTIIFIRHGATRLNNDDNSVDRLRGWRDIPLSDEGREEAERLGKSLKANPPDCIVTSNLKRAVETAEIISRIIGVKVDWKTEKFRPWDVGKYTGQLSSTAIPILLKYVDEPDRKVPDGESFHQFQRRFFSGLDEALDKYNGVIAIVSHHRDERLLRAWISAGHPSDGTVSMAVFKMKGEKTGSAERISIPEEKLDLVVGEHSRMAKAAGKARKNG